MKVWLVSVGEPLPIDEGHPKPFRTGLLAQYLLKAGHEVVWWSSTFNHSQRIYRANTSRTYKISSSFTVELLHSSFDYTRNVSVRRLLNHQQVATEFGRIASTRPCPDLVVCSYPTIDLAYEAIRYCVEEEIPSALDVRDLWPDSFVANVPKMFRPIASIALFQLEKKAKYAISNANSVTAITEDYLNWALNKAGRSKSKLDHVYPLTTKRDTFESDVLNDSKKLLEKRGVELERKIVSFVGIMSLRKFCLIEVMEGAREAMNRNAELQFVFAGSGDDLDTLSLRYPEFVFLGWVDAPMIEVLLSNTYVAITPYFSTQDFEMSVPIKVFDYLSHGLPMLNSLKGNVQNLIKSNNIGLDFEEDQSTSFREQLECLVKNREETEIMRNNARELFAREYSPNVIFDRRIQDLQELQSRTRHNSTKL